MTDETLRRFTTDLFVRAGLTAEHARTVADVLVWADLRGVDSHGVTRIPMYVRLLDDGDLNPAPTITIRTETAASIVLETDRAAGPVAMMAYHGARDASVSTSPISIGVPGGDRGPLVLDMATSVISAGGLSAATARPSGVVAMGSRSRARRTRSSESSRGDSASRCPHSDVQVPEEESTMKAWFTVPGPDGATRELRDVPVPAPAPGQVVVSVRAAGTNRGELIRGAALRTGAPAAKPAPAGTEFAGEIASVGEGVSGWKPGDRVMGRAVGSYAELVATSERALMRIPDGMSWAEAAAIPNVYVTAHDALVTNAAVAAGEAVMVTAAPSGVGTVALQIARYLGAQPVIATTRSPGKAAALRTLGAHEVIDVTKTGWVDAVMSATGGKGVDVIIDHVGGPMLADNITVLALKARLVSVGRNAGRVGDCDLDEIARKRASIIGVTFRTRTAEESLLCSERFAAHLLPAFAKGALKPVLDRTFPFERLLDAHAHMLSDTQVGKIVLTVP